MPKVICYKYQFLYYKFCPVIAFHLHLNQDQMPVNYEPTSKSQDQNQSHDDERIHKLPAQTNQRLILKKATTSLRNIKIHIPFSFWNHYFRNSFICNKKIIQIVYLFTPYFFYRIETWMYLNRLKDMKNIK